MPTKPARFLLAALIVGFLGPAAAKSLAGLAAKAALARTIASHPSLRVGGLDLDLFNGDLQLHDVAMRAGNSDVSIRRLSLPISTALADLVTPASADPAPAAGAATSPVIAPPPSPGTVRADDVAIVQATTTVRIKRVEMAGTMLSNADLASLLDPKAAGSIEARLRKVSAAAIVIPEIEVDDTTPGSERHGIMRQILLANVVAGKAAALSAAETSLALTDGQEAVNGTSGSIEAANVDLAQLAHVAETVRTDAAEPVMPLFDKAAINAIKLTNVTRDASISVASLAATGVRARALARGFASAGATVTQAAPLGIAPDPDSAALLRDLGQSVVIGTLAVDDLVSRNKASDGETSFSAAHLDLKALGSGKIGTLEMRDFHLAGPTATLAVGAAKVEALSIPRTGSNDAEQMPARPSQVDLKQVEVEVTTRDKASPDKATQITFTIDHFAAEQNGSSTSIPATSSATIDHLGFDVTSNGALTHTLYDMGYRHVSLSCVLASAYNAGAQELSVNCLSMTDPAMGAIEVALLLSNVTQGLVSSNSQIQQASAIAILAKTLDLKLTNAGLFEKALALKAQQDGVSVADERQFGVDFFANKLPPILGDGANAKSIGDAVAKFIADPRSLHISLQSKDGLGVAALGMLGDPGALLDTLDVHATADD